MSMMYCDLHDRHYDSDYDLECPVCEQEEIDQEMKFDEARDERTIDEFNQN